MSFANIKFKRGGVLKSVVSFVAVLFLAVASFGVYTPAFADGNYTVEPTGLYATLAQGEVFSGDFNIHNNSENKIDYSISVVARDVSSIETLPFEASSNPALIAEWVKVDQSNGTIDASGVANITYKINVPADSIVGGQFAIINIKLREYNGDDTVESYDATYPIYAEVNEVAWVETDADGNVISDGSNSGGSGNIFAKWWFWAIVAGIVIVIGALVIVFMPKKNAKKDKKEAPKTDE